MSPDLHGLLWRHNLKDVDLPNPVKFNLVYNAVQNEYQLQQVKVWRLVCDGNKFNTCFVVFMNWLLKFLLRLLLKYHFVVCRVSQFKSLLFSALGVPKGNNMPWLYFLCFRKSHTIMPYPITEKTISCRTQTFSNGTIYAELAYVKLKKSFIKSLTWSS